MTFRYPYPSQQNPKLEIELSSKCQRRGFLFNGMNLCDTQETYMVLEKFILIETWSASTERDRESIE